MRNTLKVERTKHNLTQQELADQLSVSRQTIMAIEAGRFNPSTKLALKLAAFLDCSVHDLFCLEDAE